MNAFKSAATIASNALSHGQERYHSAEIDLGLRVFYSKKTSYGTIRSSFNAEYHRLIQNSDDTALSYADLTRGPHYLLNLPQNGSHQVRLGLSLGLQLDNGISADRSFGSDSSTDKIRGDISWRF